MIVFHVIGTLNSTNYQGHHFTDLEGNVIEDVTHWCEIIKAGKIKK